MKKNKIKYALIALVLLLITLLSVYFLLPKDDYTKFSRAKWDLVAINRYLMIDDLLKNYKLKGKTRDEVISKLGRKELITDEKKLLMYVIERRLIDPVYLYIQFNNKGRVVEYHIGEG